MNVLMMTPVYCLLLVCSMAYALSVESLLERKLLSDVGETASVESRNAASVEAIGGHNENSGSHKLGLADRRFNLAHVRNSVRSGTNPGGVNSELHIHKDSRGDTDTALTELNDPLLLLSHKSNPHRRFNSLHGYFPSEYEETVESDFGATRRTAAREQLNQYLSPYYRALLNFAQLWSRRAQDTKESLSGGAIDTLNAQRSTIENINEGNDLESDGKSRALNEANARLRMLLRDATHNVVSNKDSRPTSRKSDSAVRANENKFERRSYEANEHYNQLLTDAVNKLASITESNKLSWRSGAPSVKKLEADAQRHLNALEEATARLSQLKELENHFSPDNEATQLSRRSSDSGVSEYENALNEALKRFASINDANRLSWDGFNRRRNQNSDLHSYNSQSDFTDTHSRSGKRRPLESSLTSSRRTCAKDNGRVKAEDNVRRSNRQGLSYLKKR